MTFTEIVNMAASRLNLSSTEAIARIGANVNYRYRRLTSSLGIQPTRRVSVSVASTPAVAQVVILLEKIETVYSTQAGRRIILDEVTYDEWRNRRVMSSRAGDPEVYAVESIDGDSTNIVLDPVPGSALTINADGLQSASTLSGTNVPQFPASFHDVLVDGAMADEYDKMDNQKMALRFEKRYEERASDLRYHFAKSAYLKVVPGESEAATPRTTRAFLNWYK